MTLLGCASIAAEPLLEVRNLEVCLSFDPRHPRCVLGGINFRIALGEVVGLLGESGAGKTTLALALLKLLPPSMRIVGGSIQLEGRELLLLREAPLRNIRGTRISIIYQDSTVLNPIMRVGDQVVEVLRAHHDWTKARCREEAKLLLQEMELEDLDRVYRSYPHQLSGGQRQRIVITQALACRPALVIADEPTSSLDQSNASAVIELLRRLNRRFGTAFLVISHDVSILASLADRIMVMNAGRIVEQGPCRKILQEPLHPYTRALLNCALPERAATISGMDRRPVPTIVGSAPEELRTSSYCAFESRCPDRMRICSINLPKEVHAASAHTVSCFRYGDS